MELSEVKTGLKIRTTKLGTTKGMLIQESYLDARRPGADGAVLGYVPGHGGDVWWVEHEDGTVAAYTFYEFGPLEPHSATPGN